jgi:hypothetical protein
VRPDTDLHRAHLRFDGDEWAPEHDAVQALRLEQILLVPVRAVLLLVRVVDADAEACGADAGEVGAAQRAEQLFVARAGEQPHERRDQLRGIVDEAPEPAVMGDQLRVARIEGRGRERRPLDRQPVAGDQDADDLVQRALDRFDLGGEVVEARQQQEAVGVEAFALCLGEQR